MYISKVDGTYSEIIDKNSVVGLVRARFGVVPEREACREWIDVGPQAHEIPLTVG